MKKVLFVNDVFTLGGVERSLEDVLKYLDYDRLEVDLCILHPQKEEVSKVDPRVRLIRIEEWKCRYSLGYLWLSVWKLLFHLLSKKEAEEKLRERLRKQYYRQERKLFFRKNYDYAIAYKHGEAAEFVAEVIRADKKIMFYHHGEILDYELHRSAFAGASVIAAVSESVADLLAEAYPEYRDRLTVIPNLVDAGFIRQKAKEYRVKTISDSSKAPEGNSFFILCSCGRLNPEKGFDLSVAAAELLNNHKLDFHWYFVGDGIDRGELEGKITGLGLEHRIMITGMLKNPLPYLAACDIYVQPSYAEAFCLSIAEAQVLGKPVVSTATLGAKYLIEDGVTGILTGFDGESLGNAILQLLQDSEKRELLIRNTQSIDYSRRVREYRELWRRLLK